MARTEKKRSITPTPPCVVTKLVCVKKSVTITNNGITAPISTASMATTPALPPMEYALMKELLEPPLENNDKDNDSNDDGNSGIGGGGGCDEVATVVVNATNDEDDDSNDDGDDGGAASICVQTQNNSLNDPAPPESKWYDWAMGSFSHTGRDTPHQEQCYSFGIRMVTCQHIGCSTKVHPLCHINWLKRHCYKQPSQHFCWQHSNCYQLWVRMGALQGKQNSAFSEWMYPRIRRGRRVDKQLQNL